MTTNSTCWPRRRSSYSVAPQPVQPGSDAKTASDQKVSSVAVPPTPPRLARRQGRRIDQIGAGVAPAPLTLPPMTVAFPALPPAAANTATTTVNVVLRLQFELPQG